MDSECEYQIVFLSQDQNSEPQENETLEGGDGGGEVKTKKVPQPRGRRGKSVKPANDQKKEPQKEEVRFTIKIDIDLLREVLCEMPMLLPYKDQAKIWKKIQRNLGAVFPVPTLQRRYKTLQEKFKSEELNSLKGSGSDEEKSERGDLLREITDLLQDEKIYPSKEETGKKDSKSEKELGEEIREAALTTKSPSCSPPTTAHKRKNMVDILAEHQAEEIKFKKLKLEQEVIQRDKDREVELRRLAIQEKFQENQAKLMMVLLEKIQQK